MNKGKRVLVVGCGITGSLTAKLLRSKFETVTIWEKFAEPGGRFNTVINDKYKDLSVDLGAQYITTTEEDIRGFNDVYLSLISNATIVAMQNKVRGMKSISNSNKNYITPCGMKSVVQSILNEANCCLHFGRKVTTLYKDTDTWFVLSECGKKEEFDVVILTIPIPEILKLSGDIKSLLIDKKDMYKKLQDVKYSSRFALGLFFEEEVHSDVDSEYIDNDPIVRFIAYDSWKSGGKNTFRSATVHTTIQFGEGNHETHLDDVKQVVIKHIKKDIYPNWPEPSSIIIHHWKYSQVLVPYVSKPGAISFSKHPFLITGGDGFIGSTFNQCIYSAKTIVDIVSQQLDY